MRNSSLGFNERSQFIELFHDRARTADASKVFLAGTSTLTYGEISHAIACLTKHFDDTGVTVGCRAMIASVDDGAVATLFLGAIAAGVTAVVIDPTASADELHVLINFVDPAVIFMDRRLIECLRAEDLDSHRTRIVEVSKKPDSLKPTASREGGDKLSGAGLFTRFPELLEQLAPAPLREDISPRTAAYILFTSGTTSTPKGVEISHSALFACYASMSRQLRMDAQSRILNVLPLHHADGLSEGVGMSFFCGATLFRPCRFSLRQLPTLLSTVHRERITHAQFVPTMLALIERAADVIGDPFTHAAFRCLISSGGPLNTALWQRFERRFGVRITNVYGLTEAARELLYCGPDDDSYKLGTNGRPVDCVAAIVDEHGNVVRHGDIGELIFRVEHAMSGYYRNPEETRKTLRGGWIFTGDLAIEDSEGFITIVGRRKNVIITGGVNVYPDEVTRVILEMPGVSDGVTLGLADANWGEKVVSCVTTEQPGQPTPQDIIGFCRQRLSAEKVPSMVFTLADLPRGPSGKVMLPEVQRLVRDMMSREERHADQTDGAVLDDTQAMVFEIAARSFKIPAEELTLESEPDDTTGWDSLGHLAFLAGLESTFSIKLSPTEMLAVMTLGDAVDLVRDKLGDRVGAP